MVQKIAITYLIPVFYGFSKKYSSLGCTFREISVNFNDHFSYGCHQYGDYFELEKKTLLMKRLPKIVSLK